MNRTHISSTSYGSFVAEAGGAICFGAYGHFAPDDASILLTTGSHKRHISRQNATKRESSSTESECTSVCEECIESVQLTKTEAVVRVNRTYRVCIVQPEARQARQHVYTLASFRSACTKSTTGRRKTDPPFGTTCIKVYIYLTVFIDCALFCCAWKLHHALLPACTAHLVG